jgi:xylulokinase
VSDASGTLLFDVHRRRWSAEVVQQLGIDPGWLPPAVDGTAHTGTVSADAAAATGLVQGTPVIAGGVTTPRQQSVWAPSTPGC